MSTEQERKERRYKYTLVGLLILLGLIIFKYTRPYMSGFLGAATLYVIVNGQLKFFMQRLKLKRSISALLIVLEVLFFILLPLTGITFLVIDTVSGISISPEAILRQINDFMDALEERLGFNIFTIENLSVLPKAGSNILQALGNSVYSFVMNVVVILFVLYYMLLNSREFETAIREVLPFKEENKRILAEETRLIIQANAVGIPLMAIIQGIFAYLGYLFFGVDNAILYAVLTAFSTILPLVGTTIVWLPLGVTLMLGGDYVRGAALLVYGFLIIGGVDNVARFLLQKKLADIHPLITVFGVLTGIPMFGFWGIIFGPLLLSLFILFFNMFRREYVPGSGAGAGMRVSARVGQGKGSVPGGEPGVSDDGGDVRGDTEAV
ncbi:MAG: AI-2E family transporter [Proteiniphilum sp.]|jgi:predicted PurR-regulated permease PerM|nr:AI-2E family transporter [Proteiniphilum sp.]